MIYYAIWDNKTPGPLRRVYCEQAGPKERLIDYLKDPRFRSQRLVAIIGEDDLEPQIEFYEKKLNTNIEHFSRK